jgi:hypothetical protein
LAPPHLSSGGGGFQAAGHRLQPTQTNTDEFTDAFAEPDKIYGVGSTYQFAPIMILEATGNFNGGDAFSAVTFTDC